MIHSREGKINFSVIASSALCEENDTYSFKLSTANCNLKGYQAVPPPYLELILSAGQLVVGLSDQ